MVKCIRPKREALRLSKAINAKQQVIHQLTKTARIQRSASSLQVVCNGPLGRRAARIRGASGTILRPQIRSEGKRSVTRQEQELYEDECKVSS